MGEKFRSIAHKVATNSRDWSQNPMYALIYGITIGWNEMAKEIQEQHGFSDAEMQIMEIMRLFYKSEKR